MSPEGFPRLIEGAQGPMKVECCLSCNKGSREDAENRSGYEGEERGTWLFLVAGAQEALKLAS